MAGVVSLPVSANGRRRKDGGLVYLFSPGGRTAPGGMARIVDYTVREWPEQSACRLKIVDTYGPGLKVLMPFYFLRAMMVLLVGLTMGRVDIVHVNMSERLSLWRKLTLTSIARLCRRPAIVHFHGAEFIEDYESAGQLRRALIRAGIRSATLSLVLGSYWRRFLAAEIGIADPRIKILWNAVPMGTTNPKPLSAARRFLFLGVVGDRKGFDTLIQALASPLLAKLRWTLAVAGGGELDRFRAAVTQVRLGDRIQFLGPLDEVSVRAELELADALVLPSRKEGLPLAILEAMAFACAVIATPVGSIADAVVDGETGLLVPPGDADALAKALLRLISDGAYCRSLGEAGRMRQQACFSLENYVRSLDAIYESCLASSTAGLTPVADA